MINLGKEIQIASTMVVDIIIGLVIFVDLY